MEGSAPAAPAAPSGGGGSPSNPQGGGTPPSGSGAPTGSQPAQPAQGGKPAAPAAPAAPKKFTRKEVIDGQEVVLEADEDTLWDSHRKRTAADRRFEESARLRREAAQERQQIDALKKGLKENPKGLMSFLRENGVEDPIEFVANLLQGELAEEEKLQDPNVRRAHEAEQKLRAIEEERREQERTVAQQQYQEQVQARLDEIAQVFDDALQTVGLPADDDTLSIMAELEMVARHQGLKTDPNKLAAAVKERVIDRALTVMSSVPDDKLLAANPELTKRFKKALTAEWKARQTKPITPPAPPPPGSAPKEGSGVKVVTDAEEMALIGGGKRILRGV